MNASTKTTKKPTMKATPFNNNLIVIGSRPVDWICERTGWSVKYPVSEVVKKLLCGGCGELHQLKQGSLSAEDLALITKITAEAKENANLRDSIDASAEIASKKIVRRDEKDTCWNPVYYYQLKLPLTSTQG